MTATAETEQPATKKEPFAPPTPVSTNELKAQAQAAARTLASLVRPVRAMTAVAVVLQVLAAAASVVPFIAMAELAKTFLADGQVNEARVWAAVWIVIAALLARLVLGGTALTITHAADLKVQRLTRTKIVERLGRVPLGWFTQRSSGTVRKATQDDIADIHYLVAHGTLDAAASVTVPIVGIIYLISLDWRLALVAVATMPVTVAIFVSQTKEMAAKNEGINHSLEQISKTIVEFVSGIAVVKTFGQAGRAHAAYRKAATDFSDAYDEWVQPMLKIEALATLPFAAPVALLINVAFGTWFFAAGWIGIVELVTATVVAVTLPASIIKISLSLNSRQTAQAAAARIGTLLETPTLPEAASPRVPTSSAVEFDSVSFSFDRQRTVLNEVSLKLPPGSVTALVGPSGSGKSTLAALLARFHDPTAGRILIGGVDIRNVATDVLYQHVGFVLQDVQLLSASVADNIRLARPDASLAEVKKAARVAQIDDHIASLPRGYDSIVGEDALLSGGQAQRISIARALLADPPILILDEATAFADPECESHIQAALSELVGNRTLLVIAHRLTSITGADQIALLQDGQIAEIGTHDQLLAAGNQYSRLWHVHQTTTQTTKIGGRR